MTSVYHRYAEDFTGKNPDNLVPGELYNLSDRPIRAVVPKYGPFFVDSLTIFDNLTKQPLDRGIDFKIPMLSQEATLKTGMTVADALLITNSAVSSQVMYNYQTIGGLYQNDIANIAAIYESYMNDSRKVDWVTGVIGKPGEYPPGPHTHFLADLYGFEPLTFELERIQQAILLGQTPAYEALVESFKSQIATIQDMDAGEASDRMVTLRGLLHVLDKYNFNGMGVIPQHDWIANGGSLLVDVTASNVAPNATYYWTVEHITSTSADFQSQSGIVQLSKGKGQFLIQAVEDAAAEDEKTFYLAIRRNGPTGQIVAKTWPLVMLSHPASTPMHIIDALTAVSTYSPQIRRTAMTVHITRSLANATYS